VSIADFIANSQTKPAVSAPAPIAEIPMEDYFARLDQTVTAHSLSDSQFLVLKKTINDYRKEIERGEFIPTTEKLHSIVAWFRISREKAIVIIKEKIVKEKKLKVTKTKKQPIIIEDLM